MDAEEMSFVDNCFSLIVSTSSLHWMDLNKVFKNIYRILDDNGSMFFSMVGESTFEEFKFLFSECGEDSRILDFISSTDLINIIQKQRFENIKISSEKIKCFADNSREILWNVKKVGAIGSHVQDFKDLGRAKRLKRIMDLYDQRYQKNGKVCVTYEILSGWIQK